MNKVKKTPSDTPHAAGVTHIKNEARMTVKIKSDFAYRYSPDLSTPRGERERQREIGICIVFLRGSIC